MTLDSRSKAERNLCNALTFAWSRSYLRWEALNRVKLGPNQYKCEKCGNVFKLREVEVDHIKPKMPVDGWDNIRSFAVRLFCHSKGLQVLCSDVCHKTKSKAENELRRQHAAA